MRQVILLLFKFTFDADRGLIFQEISSAAVSPPLLSTTNLIPGVYQGRGGYCYVLEEPTLLTNNHSLYIFKSHNEGNCQNSGGFSSQITSGLSVDNPEFGAREIVPNLKDSFVYGVISETTTSRNPTINSNWQGNELIGLRQAGNDLVVGLFSDGVDNNGNIVDFKEPRGTIVLKKLEL